MKHKMPIKDIIFHQEHIKVVDKILEDITEEQLQQNGISSMSIIAEKTMAPCLLLKYADGTEESFRGYEEMANRLQNLK